jgi:hypothetical protein
MYRKRGGIIQSKERELFRLIIQCCDKEASEEGLLVLISTNNNQWSFLRCHSVPVQFAHHHCLLLIDSHGAVLVICHTGPLCYLHQHSAIHKPDDESL